MNREDVAKDLAVENNEILRGRLEQAEALFCEYDQRGHSEGWWHKVRIFLASQQGEQEKNPEQAEGAQGEREAAIAKFAETCPMTAESADGGKSYDIELRRYYLLGWEDRTALAQPSPAGEVVVTKDEAGAIVAVTRQDADGQVLSVIAESAQPSPAPELERPVDYGFCDGVCDD